MASLPEALHGWLDTLLTPALWGLMLGLSVASLLLAALAIPVIVVRLPANYFQLAGHYARRHSPWTWWRLLFHVGKNLVGLVLLLAGIAMLVLPGQGLLTILAALFCLDFPGKWRLERRLLSRPAILKQVNRIRERAGQPPLVL